MPLSTTYKMLQDAKKNRYAVGAFNAENMEMIQGILEAAESTKSPVIIQTTPSTVRYASLELYRANVEEIAKKLTIPAAIHLDHGDGYPLVLRALRAGYTSIMIDGSREILSKNMEITKLAVDAASHSGVPVEGELGRVGGKEDDISSEETGFTDPDEAGLFVKTTGVCSLAVGVGTAHGVYAVPPKLNKELISILSKRLDLPLVLHGGSGLSEEDLQDCIKRGIAKVNFATDLRIAYTNAVKAELSLRPDTADPKKFGAKGREAVKELVMEKIRIIGSAGRAGGL
jgi:tagatose 1,6-diphosphate aldolase GatY/KbaY